MMDSLAEEIVAAESRTRDAATVYYVTAGSFLAFAALEVLAHEILAARFTSLPHGSLIRLRGCAISSLHDLWAMAAVVLLVQGATQPAASPPAAGPLGVALHTHVPFALMDPIGSVLLGFLLWDVLHHVAHRSTYAKVLVEVLVHHACFMTMILLNKNTLWFNYAFAPLYLAEVSTLFLNIRTAYRELGGRELWASAAFAATFLATRVLIFGALACIACRRAA